MSDGDVGVECRVTGVGGLCGDVQTSRAGSPCHLVEACATSLLRKELRVPCLCCRFFPFGFFFLLTGRFCRFSFETRFYSVRH